MLIINSSSGSSSSSSSSSHHFGNNSSSTSSSSSSTAVIMVNAAVANGPIIYCGGSFSCVVEWKPPQRGVAFEDHISYKFDKGSVNEFIRF